ncbi:MAG: transposon-transfer assisting family protein [Lachnospiraceae bacterium]|nr:transposon-transfer assisting family protein [Lachnospiraceae bacterium]
MNFTGKELMLMMIYSPGTRPGLIEALKNMRGELTKSERSLRALTDSVLGKLEKMTDKEFEELPLYPDIDP